VVLALAILSLIAALGLPFLRRGSGASALRLKTFEITALLRSERNRALRSGQTSTIVIDSKAGTIRSTVSFQRVDVTPDIAMQLAPAGLAGVQFYPDGRASAAQLTIGAGKFISVIDVNALTATVNSAEESP
jgi:general secretion pathway protein H